MLDWISIWIKNRIADKSYISLPPQFPQVGFPKLDDKLYEPDTCIEVFFVLEKKVFFVLQNAYIDVYLFFIFCKKKKKRKDVYVFWTKLFFYMLFIRLVDP